MPTHENLASLRNANAKVGLDGAAGGHAEVPSTATGAGSARYDAQPALGDPFQTVWDSVTGVDEVQRLTITGSPTGGTFTVTYGGQTTAAIPYNATARQVEDALIALSSLDAGDVEVTGGPLPATAVDLQFGGDEAAENVAQVTASGAGLTGGSSPAVTPSTVTAGAA
jgi:hypothetical protein